MIAGTLARSAAPVPHRPAPQGAVGVGPFGVVLIAALVAVGTTVMTGQIFAQQGEMMKLLRHQQSSQLVMQTAQRLAAEAGDADGDGFRETPMMRLGVGGPAGGGLIPPISAAGKVDGWGRPLGYCAWNYGSAMTAPDLIDPGRASTNATEITMLVVSAGPNGVFETACPADPNGVVPTAGGDDLVVGFTAAEVAQRASLTDAMLEFLNRLIAGQYRNGNGDHLDIGGTLTVGSGLPAGTPALTVPDGTVQALNKRLSQAVYDVTSARAGQVLPQPTCPSGLTPEIHVAFSHLAADNVGTSWSAAQAYATPTTSGGAPAWQIGVDVRTPAGWTTPVPADVMRVLVIRKCS